MKRARELLHRLAGQLQVILKEDLVGIYVHGSLAMGCFDWRRSDIDFLVVTEGEITQRKKEDIIDLMLRESPTAPPKGLEMSVVTRQAVTLPQHPIPFLLHFSPAYLQRAGQGIPAFCREMNGRDPDLAAHFTVTRSRGYALFGPTPGQLFAPVAREAYLQSILSDVQDAVQEVLRDPVYMMLNLCRVLACAQEGLVLSKKEGGEWAQTRLPRQYAALAGEALAAYDNAAALPAGAAQQQFCSFVLKEIYKLTKK